MVGGIIPLFRVFIHVIASIAPAAPSKWPVIDFVELIDTFLASLPKTFLMA